MKNYLLAMMAGGLLFTATGCGPTVAEIMEMHNNDLAKGDFKQSMPLMQELIAEDEDNSHEDTPMWRLMVANAKMLSKDEKAIEEFDAAEDVILANDKKTVTYVQAMLVNDKYLTFKPGFQDRMFFSLDKAIMYGAVGKNDEARTELNRMMQYQENWLHERRQEIAASTDAMTKSLQPAKPGEDDMPEIVTNELNKLKVEAQKSYENFLSNDNVLSLILKHCNYDLQNSGDISKLEPQDYQNAYATHFCGVFRWLNNDDASEYLQDAAKLKKDNKAVAADLAAIKSGAVLKDEVWVYVEDGLCPVREEVRIDLPLALVPFASNYIKYLGIALPKLVERDYAAQEYTVAGVKMEELENIDRLFKTEYDVYMNSAVKRELLRCLLKTLPQVAAGIVKENSKDPQVKFACTGIQYAAAGYAEASTHADLRTWNVLPKRVLMQRVKRPADGVIKLTADNQTIEIKVPAGNSIVWVRKVAASSPFIVNQINFADKK